MTIRYTFSRRLHLYTVLMAGMAFVAHPMSALAATDGAKPPSLIITSDPLPESLRRQVYSKPTEVRAINASDIMGGNYYSPTQTLISGKVNELTGNLQTIQDKISSLSGNLSGVQRENEELSAEYYSNVATINTQLQSGTTPGNPRLVSRLSEAESQLERLGASVSQLNGLAVQAAAVASEASFLLEETRAAYSLSGAVEEDHVALAQLEDNINNTMVIVERVLNTVNDDITRTSTYMSSERDNLRTLALGVTNGDLYGKSLANRPFSGAPQMGTTQASYTPSDAPVAGVESAVVQSMPSAPQPAPDISQTNMRPLVKIRFDRPDVDYEQPIYMAVNEALQRYPDARFELVAVHPTKGNAAEVAIESTKARRNAENVLRSLTQMGMPMDRIDLSYAADGAAAANEVHLYLK